MSIYLGDLTVQEFEKRTGWTFQKEDRDFLKKHRTGIADFKDEDKFHIHEIPFSIRAGADIIEDLKNIILKYNDKKECKERFMLLPKK